MRELQSESAKALQVLAGLQLSIASYAGNMRVFGFGLPRELDGGVVGDYSLHLQCAWRISRGGQVVTGSSDWYLPEDEENFEKVADESWDPALGGSLQEAKLVRLFDNERVGVRPIVNMTSSLVVTGLHTDALGGFELLLSPNYALAAFPASSRGEHWRLFQPQSGPHFVVEGSPVPGA